MYIASLFSLLFCISTYLYPANILLHFCLLGFVIISVMPKKLVLVFDIVHTLIHEIGHGFAAEMTNGEWVNYNIDKNGGYCVSSGGNKILVVLSGYLGTILLGCLLMLSGFNKVYSFTFVFCVGLFIFSVSFLKSENLRTKVLSLLVGLFLMVISYIGKDIENASIVFAVLLSDFIIYSSLFSLLCLRTSVKISSSVGTSDAHQLAGILECHPVIAIDLLLFLGFGLTCITIFFVSQIS